jgi:hypothetical protein
MTCQMPDEYELTRSQADHIRTDLANLEIGQEFPMQQLARQPTRKDMWRAALIGMLGGSALTLSLALAFWH